MAVAPQEYAGQGGDHPARPVLGALYSALGAMTDSQPERLWALSEGEVVEAVRALGELSATVAGHLVAVLAEAKARGLGTGDGWGPVDGATGPRGLSERDMAICVRRTGDLLRPDELVERDADTVRAHRSLTKARGPVGLSRYTLLLDDEGAAVVDAAVEALARPHRDED